MTGASITCAIDNFLAVSLGFVMDAVPPPRWPADWPQTPAFYQQVFARIAFHGVALALLQDPERLANWPGPVRERLRQEAFAQSFWEMGHKAALTRLITVLSDAGAGSIIMKGSALAYSAYSQPAIRRRGDSDLLIGEVRRKPVRAAMAAKGFRPIGDARPLQESWATECVQGFTHIFDLHWQVNASALLTKRLERAGVGGRTVPLPRLSGAARAIAPTDNLVLIAINRASHETFGYLSGEAKLFEHDRLIWALDVDLLCGGFAAEDWQALLATTAASGAAPFVRSALALAEMALGTLVPPEIVGELDVLPDDPALLHYFQAMPGIDRLRCDLAASPTVRAKLRLARYSLFPGAEVLHERFPDATHWPLAALQARRLVAGAVGKLLAKRV